MMYTVAHQFEDAEQQHHAAALGMWTFLATEVLFFSGLFVAYTVYRINNPDAFSAASGHLYEWIGAVNTAVLLISSMFMAYAVQAAARSQRASTLLFLSLTVALGAIFLALKGVEYSLDYAEQLVPAVNFEYHGPADPSRVELFMVLYYVMTGLHALHVLIGVGCIAVLAVLSRRRRFVERHATAIEMTGLYWHFVDIVWIFLFPLLYLI